MHSGTVTLEVSFQKEMARLSEWLRTVCQHAKGKHFHYTIAYDKMAEYEVQINIKV
jgi:hypothetical protein